jgi:dihydrofolate synthase / folylpolyglutamate synthase
MDALQYLLSLEKFGIKFGLANIQKLCAALGDPQTKYRSVLIAGTNGKGSVTAMVDCGLRAGGVKVGRYTSPHLMRLEERFTINGESVDTPVLVDVVEKIRKLINMLLTKGALEAPPTFFEVTTAVAFELFRRAGVQFAVLEVGLGGRLDSTNIVEPVAAAITTIDFDHEQYLGNTLAAIAAEKGGIIRRGIPVVIGPVPGEARDVLASMCAAAGAKLVEAGSDVRFESKTTEGRTSIRLETPARDYGWIPLGLRGAHQVSNAIVAVRLLEHLGQLVPLKADAIVSGVRDVRWPGRLQMIEAEGGRHVLLDAAHNPAGAWALATYLKREFPEPLPIVFGAMRDKDAALMLKTLLPVVSQLVMTEPSTPRARSADELAAIARKLSPRSRIETVPEPRAALDRAWTYCPVVCAAGSVFLVGDLLATLGPAVRDV